MRDSKTNQKSVVFAFFDFVRFFARAPHGEHVCWEENKPTNLPTAYKIVDGLPRCTWLRCGARGTVGGGQGAARLLPARLCPGPRQGRGLVHPATRGTPGKRAVTTTRAWAVLLISLGSPHYDAPFFDFVWLPTRTVHPHGVYVRWVNRHRLDPHVSFLSNGRTTRSSRPTLRPPCA